MTKQAALVKTNGQQFPGEREIVWRLRSGTKGAGRILHEARGRGREGRQQAADLCIAYADQHGFEIVARIEDGETYAV